MELTIGRTRSVFCCFRNVAGAAVITGIFAFTAAAQSRFFAATASSYLGSSLLAAEESSRALMEKFAAQGTRPDAVLFLERTSTVKSVAARYEIGKRVSEITGAPTFGQGGTSSRPIVGFPDSTGWATFFVFGLRSDQISMKGYAAGGHLDNILYPSTAEQKAKADSLKAVAAARGRIVAGQVNADDGAVSLLMVVGGFHDPYQCKFVGGMRELLEASVPVLGGTTNSAEWIYCDGKQLHDPATDTLTASGQFVVAFRGASVGMGGVSVTETQPDSARVAWYGTSAVNSANAKLGQGSTRLLFAFSAGRLKDNPLVSPRVLNGAIQKSAGDNVVVFGGSSGSQIGEDNNDASLCGPYKLVVAAVGIGSPTRTAMETPAGRRAPVIDRRYHPNFITTLLGRVVEPRGARVKGRAPVLGGRHAQGTAVTHMTGSDREY